MKLQILNLAVKLYLTNPAQTQLLVQYVFTLARYDQSYDLRDRARFLRNLIMPQKTSKLTKFAKEIFLTPKPAPVIESTFKGTPFLVPQCFVFLQLPFLDRDQFQLGTLSHYLNQRCAGYRDLPDFPDVPPDASVRTVEGWGVPTPSEKRKAGTLGDEVSAIKTRPTEKFYSDDEEENEAEEESSEEKGTQFSFFGFK